MRSTFGIFAALATLAACSGTPGGFVSGPDVGAFEYNQQLEGCSTKSWAYPEPQAQAVYIDCMTAFGYVPNEATTARREELRAMGY